MNPQEEAMIELETKLAYQEHAIAELNDVILSLRRDLERLAREVELMRDRVENGQQEIGPANDRPPHW